MNTAKSLILSLCLPLAGNLFALDISTEAGSLGMTMRQVDYTTTSLTISGSLNAADFDFINHNLKNLTDLDLKAATIAAYSGERVLTGGTAYDADELPAFSLMGIPLQRVVLPASLLSIGEGALASTSITETTLPDGLMNISAHAFSACSDLKSIVIPATVTSMGNGVFADCKALETVDLGSLATIAPRTFDGCVSLSKVTSSPTVSTIGQAAFRSTSSLANFEFPASLKTIDPEAFYQSGIKIVDLSPCFSLGSIGDFAFAKCGMLTDVIFIKNAKIGQGVFFDDCSLSTFELPSAMSIIPEFTFKGASSINPGAILGIGLTEVRDYAFTGWSNIVELALPESLEYIGDNAMEGWTSLNTLDVSEIRNVPELGQSVWENVDQPGVTLTVHPDDVDVYTAADQWNRFNIKAKKLDTTTEAPGIGNSNNGIEVAYRDNTLSITSAEERIANVIIYDLDGRRIYAKPVDAQRIEISTEGWNSVVVAAKVTLANGATTSFKAQVAK